MELAEVVGHLVGLRRFPVRGLAGETPDEARVQGSGLAGDRVFDLYDQSAAAILSAPANPFLLRYRARYLDPDVRGDDFGPWIRVRKPDGEEVALSDAAWVDDVSRRCGREVRLRPRPEAQSDPAPLHLISVPTLRFLEQQYGGPVEPSRLRANAVLELPDRRAFEEDRWIGRQLWVGDVLVEIVQPSEDCVVATLDADTPERSPGLLAAIVRGRQGRLGVRTRALTGNRLRVGDPVAIID
ncbi:MAG TPA: MOSC domain-containing protein [Thermoanaerobaculia bacterium]|nr:MOSC domain-containing protein [Thermoanaerobaculia bacterium]